MSAVAILFMVLMVISAVVLVLLVLLHSGRGAGVSEMFGGVMPSTSTGTSIIEKNLDRITVIAASVFIGSLIVLMVVYK